MGTPRRRIPTSPKPSTPPFFSRISWARRTSVRSISEPDINCAFCVSVVLRTAFFFVVVMLRIPHQNRFAFRKGSRGSLFILAGFFSRRWLFRLIGFLGGFDANLGIVGQAISPRRDHAITFSQAIENLHLIVLPDSCL